MRGQARMAAAAALGLAFMCCLGGCDTPVSKDEEEKTLSGTISGWTFGAGCTLVVQKGTDGAILTDGPYPISSSGEFSVPYPGNLKTENTRDMGWATSKGYTVSDTDARMGMLFLSVRNSSNSEIGELMMSKGESHFYRLYYFTKPVTISGTYTGEDYFDDVQIAISFAGWNRLFFHRTETEESTTTIVRTGLSTEGYSWILYED